MSQLVLIQFSRLWLLKSSLVTKLTRMYTGAGIGTSKCEFITSIIGFQFVFFLIFYSEDAELTGEITGFKQFIIGAGLIAYYTHLCCMKNYVCT